MNKTQIRNATKGALAEHLGIDDAEEWTRDELMKLALSEREEAEKLLAVEDEIEGRAQPDEEEDDDAVREDEAPEDEGEGEEEDLPELSALPPEAVDMNDLALRIWQGQGTMPTSDRIRRVIKSLRQQRERLGITEQTIRDHLKLPTTLDHKRYL